MTNLPILIYDGDCSFCSTTIRLISRLIPNSPSMAPYQWTRLGPLEISLEECKKQIQFVVSPNLKFSGASAFANFLTHSPFPWKFLGLTMKLPLIKPFSSLIYGWVAANRYRLPGGTPTCKMPKFID